ncbi:hypothetical protein ACSSS7_006454 [Eimeria intestinalis]
MQNAWSALRGAVHEINAVLLSEDEEEEEDNVDDGPQRQRRELEVLLKQQQAQHEAAARQLEQSEAETAKYAKQLASLRRECRHLRAQLGSQQQHQQQQPQQVNGLGGEGDSGILGGAHPGSRGSSGHTVLHEAYTSAMFQALLTQPIARSLPLDLLTWLHEGEGGSGWPLSGSITPGGLQGGPLGAPLNTPLISCVMLTARLVRCAGALAVSGTSEGFDEGPSEGLGGAPGRAPGAPLSGTTGGPPSSREASLVNTPRLEEVGGESSSGIVQSGAGSCEIEKKLRDEVAKRQQLQHQAAALQRRVMELTEDLQDSKQQMNERREAERERAKTAEIKETERLRDQLHKSEERLATVRELYEHLLQQYERRHAEVASPSSGDLDREVKDLLLQLRSWQEALAELAELRADAAVCSGAPFQRHPQRFRQGLSLRGPLIGVN